MVPRKNEQVSATSTASTRKPERIFRIGFISASVFTHDVNGDGSKRTIRSVSVQKRYLDGEDVKYTSSVNLAELPQAIRALELAQQHVERCEAEIQIGD